MFEVISSNQGKYNDFQIIEGHKELMFTPQDTVIKIMDWVLPQVMIDDVLFDGFKGEGSFLYQFPDNMVSDYCEIDEGLDFFFAVDGAFVLPAYGSILGLSVDPQVAPRVPAK